MKLSKLNIISKIDEIDLYAWNLLIQESDENCEFQSHEMFSFWNNQKGYQPFVFAVKDEKGMLKCICTVVIIENGKGLKKYISRRAIVYGGPIFKKGENKKEVLLFLLEKMDTVLSTKATYIEIRNFQDYSEFKEVYEIKNWKYIPYQNYKIALTNEDEVFALFNAEKRRQIRKALREGISISYGNTEENIINIYEVIAKIYNDKVKKPLPSLSFFKDLMKLNNTNAAAVVFENKVIGGAFFLYDDNEIYDWYRGGLDYEYKKKYPSTVAAWAVMKYGLENKIYSFDFMGAGIKGEEYGVRKFKSQFGGELVEYGRFIKLYKPTLYKVGKFGLKLLKRLR